MVVGLGTGSTVACLLPALAARRLDIHCVATSPRTERAARELGIPLQDFDTLARSTWRSTEQIKSRRTAG